MEFKSRSFASLALLALVLITGVASHSWVACTDYTINSQADADYYNSANCKAYPRGWSTIYSPGAFGSDTGFNYQGTENQACRDKLGTAPGYGYTNTYPMANYAPGQRVCLAWPSKNHVAESCTNPYIPDTSLQVFISGPNPTADPSQSAFEKNVITAALNGQHANGVIDHLGFQNCSKFCENMDKSLCNGCFTVPKNLAVGSVYTFQWYWIFNAGSAPYTTCWEAMISGTAVSSGSSGTSNTASSGSSATSNTASSGSSATSNTASSGSSATSNTASSGSSDTSNTASSGSSATSNTASSGSSATSNTASSGSATSNTATSASGSSSGSASSGSSSSGSEFIVISNAPTTIPLMGSFKVEVAFVTTTTRQAVIEVFDYQNNGYGKGVSTVNGKGASDIPVTLYSVPTKGANYKIRATLVVNGYSNDYAGYELDYVEVPCGAGDSAVYANGGNSTVSSAMPKGSHYSAYLPFVCIVTFLLAFVIAL